MDGPRALQLRKELDVVLDLLREKGLAVIVKRGLYTDTEVSFRITIAEERSDGVAMTKEATNFQKLAEFVGMKPEWLGQIFFWKGDNYKIIGYATNRRVYPVLAQNIATREILKFRIDTVIHCMEFPKLPETNTGV